MSNFRIGLKYGLVRKVIKKMQGTEGKKQRKAITNDMKHAGEELLDCLMVSKPKTLKDFIKIVDSWLSLEAKMTGFKPTKYLIGEGRNIFGLIIIERVIFYRKPKE